MAIAAWLGKPASTPAVMNRVLIALLPAIAVAAWFFGWMLLVHCVIALAVGAGCEALCQRLRKRPVRIFADRSTPVTCLLIAIGIPPSAPLWIAVVAVGIAILLAKELYGGLGRNVFNPAMAGYAASSCGLSAVHDPRTRDHGRHGPRRASVPGWTDTRRPCW